MKVRDKNNSLTIDYYFLLQQSSSKRKRSEPAPTLSSTTVTLGDIEKAYTLSTAHAFLRNFASNNPKIGIVVQGKGIVHE